MWTFITTFFSNKEHLISLSDDLLLTFSQYSWLMSIEPRYFYLKSFSNAKLDKDEPIYLSKLKQWILSIFTMISSVILIQETLPHSIWAIGCKTPLLNTLIPLFTFNSNMYNLSPRMWQKILLLWISSSVLLLEDPEVGPHPSFYGNLWYILINHPGSQGTSQGTDRVSHPLSAGKVHPVTSTIRRIPYAYICYAENKIFSWTPQPLILWPTYTKSPIPSILLRFITRLPNSLQSVWLNWTHKQLLI